MSFQSALTELMKAPEYQASQSDIEAIELDYSSRELVLAAQLELNGERLEDHRQLLSTSSTVRPRIDSFGATLRKPFSTGTEIEIGPSYERALTPFLSPDRRSTVDWQILITQNLWKDAFGRSTKLRRARENFERKKELAASLLTQSQLLVEFESLYWDWALNLREAELQEKNVRRSREILRWVQGRFNRSAADSGDLLQAKAMLTQRELKVAELRSELIRVGTQIARYSSNVNWQPDSVELSVVRNPDLLASQWKADELSGESQLQYLLAKNEAMAAAERARETRESVRPELSLQASYGKNAIDPDGTQAIHNSFDDSHEYSTIGVVFRTGLDLSDESRKVEASKAQLKAAQQRMQAAESSNAIAWTQLKSDLTEQSNRLIKAKELVELQGKKADAERERFRKGRSTAFQAITFEQDAAEAEIMLWQLYAQMRKTEAQARLFVR